MPPLLPPKRGVKWGILPPMYPLYTLNMPRKSARWALPVSPATPPRAPLVAHAAAVRARDARPARPKGALCARLRRADFARSARQKKPLRGLCARLRRADAAADKAAAARTLGDILYMYRLRLASPHHGLLYVRNHSH